MVKLKTFKPLELLLSFFLERMDYLAPVHGAVCCDHLWEDEAQLHD